MHILKKILLSIVLFNTTLHGASLSDNIQLNQNQPLSAYPADSYPSGSDTDTTPILISNITTGIGSPPVIVPTKSTTGESWTNISAGNITDAGNDSYCITSGGNYTLTGYVAPTTTAVATICINANDVVLDLAGHTIDGSASTNDLPVILINGKKNISIQNGHIRAANGTAIEFAANCDNVRIYNMTIEDTAREDAILVTTGNAFTFNNINIIGVTLGHGINVSGAVEDLVIENFKINGIATAAKSGISLASTCFGVKIKNGKITNIAGSTASDGIICNSACYNMLFSDLNIANIAGTGINIGTTVHNVLIKDCNIATSTTTNMTFGNGCYGIILDGVRTTGCKDSIVFTGAEGTATVISDVVIKNCNISGATRNDNNDVNGLKFSFAESILIQDTTIGKCVVTTPGEEAFGVYFTTCTNIRCQNVKSGGHLGDGVAGFNLINVRGAIFDNCESQGNHAIDSTSTETCTGFFVETSTAVTFNNCISSGHTAKREAQGFLYSNAIGCIAENCIANSMRNSNTVSSANPMFAGFFSVSGIGNLWRNCIAENNFAGTATGTDGEGAIGFYLSSEAQSSLIDCKARGHGALYNHTANAIGIYLDTRRSRVGMKLEDCQYCQVRSCEASSNCTSALTGTTAYGIRDDAANTKNIIIECFAFGNSDSNTTTRVVTNYYMDLAIGTTTPGNWPRIETNMDGLIDLSNTPDYYNVSITS
ncbi:MAG: hypothetical protein ACJAZS_000057 [Alteromonas naphthalenivorans]|jgi:hypothetical protein